jgi:ABC-type lipoprotein export system ATPase subunit
MSPSSGGIQITRGDLKSINKDIPAVRSPVLSAILQNILLPSSLTITDLIHIADLYYVYKHQIKDDSTALNYIDLLDILKSLKKLLEHINY